MTGVGDNPRDLYEYIRETRRRLVSLERRQPPDVTAFPKTGGSATERDAYYGVPIDNSQRALLANKKVWWYNTDQGWAESYYAVTGLPGLTAKALVAGTASGWYPIGPGPHAFLQGSGGQAASGSGAYSAWTAFGTNRSFRSHTMFSLTGANLYTSMPGRYLTRAQMGVPNGSGTGVVSLYSRTAAAVNILQTQYPVPLLASYGQFVTIEQPDLLFDAGAYIFFNTDAATWTIGGNDANTNLSLKYLGPALVSA